jgi:hypothetical protein
MRPDAIEWTAPVGDKLSDSGGMSLRRGRDVEKPARGTCAINGAGAREKSQSHCTNIQISVVRRHVVRSAAQKRGQLDRIPRIPP